MLKPIIDFDFWGLPIYWIMLLVGFLLAFRSLSNRQKATWCPPAIRSKTRWAFILAAFGGGVCANVIGWFLHPEYLRLNITDRFMAAGFSFYYGMLGFFAVSALLLLMMRLDTKYWINQIVPAVLIINIFGRIGCSLSGCCYGAEITMFGLTFAFPARELEALATLAMIIIFSKIIKQHRLFWCLSCYSVLRFLLEFGRADDRGVLFISWLSPAQVTSILVWIGLAAYFVIMKFALHKNPLEKYDEAPAQQISVPTEQKLKRFRRSKKFLAIVLVFVCIGLIWNPLQITSLNVAKQSVLNIFNGIGSKRSYVETIAESSGTTLQQFGKESITSKEAALSLVQSADSDVGGTFEFHKQQQLPSGNQVYSFHQNYKGKPIFNSGRQLVVSPDNMANYMVGESIPLSGSVNSRASGGATKSSSQALKDIIGENVTIKSTTEGYSYDPGAIMTNTLRGVDQVAFELASGIELCALVDHSSGEIIKITSNANASLGSIAQATDAFLSLCASADYKENLKNLNNRISATESRQAYYYAPKITIDSPKIAMDTTSVPHDVQVLNRVFATILLDGAIDGVALADILTSSLMVADNLATPNLWLYREILMQECKSYYVSRGQSEREGQRCANVIDRAMKEVGIKQDNDEPVVNITMADTAVKIAGNINFAGDIDAMILNTSAGRAQTFAVTTETPIIVSIMDETNSPVLSVPVEKEEIFKIYPSDENETYYVMVSDDPFAQGKGAYSISIQPERAAEKQEKVPSYITTKLRQVEHAYNTSRASKFVSLLHFMDSNDDALAKFIQMSGLLSASAYLADSCMGYAGINNELMDTNKMTIAQCLFLNKEIPQEIAFSLKNTILTMTYLRHTESPNGSYVKAAVAIGLPDAPPILKGTLYMEIRYVNNEDIARSASEIAEEIGLPSDVFKSIFPNLFSGYYICDDLNSARVRNGLGVGKDELAQDDTVAHSLYTYWQDTTVNAGRKSIGQKKFDRTRAKATGLWTDDDLDAFEAFTLRYNIGVLKYEIRRLEQENEWAAILPDLISTGKDVRDIYKDIANNSHEFLKGESAKRLGIFRMLVDPEGAIFDLMLDDMRVNAVDIIRENEADIEAIRNLLRQMDPNYSEHGTKTAYPAWAYNSNKYDKDLAETAALYAMLAYDEYFYNSEEGSYYTQKKRNKPPTPVSLQSQLYTNGFLRVRSANYGNDNEHDISYTLAYQYVNKNDVLLAVVLRGTDSAEWRGNMDVGRGSRHESFEKANQSLQNAVSAYISKYQLDNIIFYVTGHSRGAAVANLFAEDLNRNAAPFESKESNIFCYTFATPNNTTAPTKDKNIFNFTFDDDFVPQVPLARWNYRKNGKTFTASAQMLYGTKSDFKELMDTYIELSYNRKPSFDQAATEQVLDDFFTLAPNVDIYYTKKYAMAPDHGILTGEKNQTMHGFMRNYVADAAISLWNVSAVAGTAFKSWSPIGNDVHKVANFFVDGFGMRKSINDTHQAFTYYAALQTGGFPTPK